MFEHFQSFFYPVIFYVMIYNIAKLSNIYKNIIVLGSRVDIYLPNIYILNNQTAQINKNLYVKLS